MNVDPRPPVANLCIPTGDRGNEVTGGTRSVASASLLLLVSLTVLLAATAQAQVDPTFTPNFVVVCEGMDCDDWFTDFPSLVFGVSVFPDPGDTDSTPATALTEALRVVQADPDDEFDTIFIRNGTWNGPADPITQDIFILGVGEVADVPDNPWEIIVQGGRETAGLSGNPAFEISGAIVTIDGVTLTDGTDGVLVNGTMGDPSFVTLNRLYIIDNSANGVRISGVGTTTLIVNCSIVQNVGDGILVDDNADQTTTEIKFCSLIANQGNGLFVNLGNSATISNSLVFKNGPGALGTGNVGGLHAAAPGGLITSGGFNDVYDNNTRPPVLADAVFPNYINVNPAGTDKSADPGLELTVGAAGDLTVPPDGIPEPEWIGEITDAIDSVEIIDAADPGFDFSSMPEAQTDLEFDTRPQDALLGAGDAADIGADETNSFTSSFCLWTGVEIDPNPVGPLPAGDLKVTIQMLGFVQNAFILPQGGNIDLIEDRIQLRLSDLSGNGATFVGVNAEDIETIVRSTGVAGPEGDVFADGHAAVYCLCQRLPGTIIGFSTSSLTDGGRITGNAVNDRHFIIDTIAPRMIGGFSGTLPVGATDIVTLLNGFPLVPDDIPLPQLPEHPFPRIPNSFRQAIEPAPFDDGLIFPTPNSSNGAQIFFNVESISNLFATFPAFPPNPKQLRFRVQVTFEDIDVHAALGIPGQPLPFSNQDRDRFDTSDQTRQVSGFVLPVPAPTTGDIPTVLQGTDPNRPAIAQWVFQPDSDTPPTNPAIAVTPILVPMGIDLGFFPATPIIENTEPTLESTWFVGDVFASPNNDGISRDLAQPKLHLSTKFRAIDDAGNVTARANLLDPLHIWWIRDTMSRILPNREGTDVANPKFTFRLDRSFDPRSAGQLQPLFLFRLWQSQGAGRSIVSYNDIYLPVTDWQGWDFLNQIGSDFFLDPVLGLPTDTWYLIVLIGTDEAGNVQQWPVTELFLDPGTENVTVLQSSGKSWQRFFLTTESGLNTSITAEFWHENMAANMVRGNALPDTGEPNFGNAYIIPLPEDVIAQQVFVRFRIKLTLEDASILDDANTRVRWELFREGQSLAQDIVFAQGSDSIVITLPRERFDATPISTAEKLGDQSRNRAPVSYVFQAAAILPDGTPDATPANFFFTIVGDVAEFIENKQSPDQQPIKVLETQ